MKQPAADSTSADTRARRLSTGIARGDHACLDEFYREWFDRCLLMISAATHRDHAFCMDVLHDAMLRIVRSMRAMPTEADMARWLARVLYTAALDRLRADRRRAAREQRRATPGVAAASSGGTRDTVDADPELIEALLSRLDGTDRSLLVMRLVQGLSLPAAGRALGISHGAAHGRIRRALARLRGEKRGTNDQ